MGVLCFKGGKEKFPGRHARSVGGGGEQGTTPSITVSPSHYRTSPTVHLEVLSGGASSRWEEAGDPARAGNGPSWGCGVAWDREKEIRGWSRGAQGGYREGRDVKVARIPRTVGLTLQVMGSNGRCVNRGEM